MDSAIDVYKRQISVDDALTQAIHGIPVEEDDESDFDDGEE